MIQLEIFTLTLEADRAVKGNAQQLRGYFATKFNEYILLHHHNADKFVYRYPLVQYKMIQNTPTVIGINEGSDLLKEIYHLSPSIRLGEDEYRIIREGIDVRRLPFGLDTTFRTYEFITPWIALNQENYQAFYRAKNAEERRDRAQADTYRKYPFHVEIPRLSGPRTDSLGSRHQACKTTAERRERDGFFW